MSLKTSCPHHLILSITNSPFDHEGSFPLGEFEPEVCSFALRSRTYQTSRLEGLGPSSQLVRGAQQHCFQISRCIIHQITTQAYMETVLSYSFSTSHQGGNTAPILTWFLCAHTVQSRLLPLCVFTGSVCY